MVNNNKKGNKLHLLERLNECCSKKNKQNPRTNIQKKRTSWIYRFGMHLSKFDISSSLFQESAPEPVATLSPSGVNQGSLTEADAVGSNGGVTSTIVLHTFWSYFRYMFTVIWPCQKLTCSLSFQRLAISYIQNVFHLAINPMELSSASLNLSNVCRWLQTSNRVTSTATFVQSRFCLHNKPYKQTHIQIIFWSP